MLLPRTVMVTVCPLSLIHIFDISAPEDAAVENELQAMGAEERSKQAIAMLATGIYPVYYTHLVRPRLSVALP